MTTTKRISLTIDTGVLENLDYLCNKLSVTRSSLISEFLRPTVSDVRKIVDFALPESSTDANTEAPRTRNPEQLREFLINIAGARLDAASSEFEQYQSEWGDSNDSH